MCPFLSYSVLQFQKVVANLPEIFIKIVVSAQCKHYFKLISKKDQIAYQPSCKRAIRIAVRNVTI
jgi:hypothetical protein